MITYSYFSLSLLIKVEYLSVGSKSKTDMVLMYLPNGENEENYRILKEKITNITIPSLTLSQQSLSECLLRKSKYEKVGFGLRIVYRGS